MSRFFHTLVVVGAAISAAACGGKSESQGVGEGANGGASGSGGTGTGGNAASGGSSASSGKGGGANGGSANGGSANGGSGGGDGGTVSTTGGTGGSGHGGTSGVGGSNAGTGGIDLGGGSGGKGGMSSTGPFPKPELPTSQWDCTNFYSGCVDALGVTAHQLTADCLVNDSLPKSAADCGVDEIYSCMLAVTVSGDPVLVNCDCWATGGEDACLGCISLNHRNGEPVSCTPSLKICECAYTGILR